MFDRLSSCDLVARIVRGHWPLLVVSNCLRVLVSAGLLRALLLSHQLGLSDDALVVEALVNRF